MDDIQRNRARRLFIGQLPATKNVDSEAVSQPVSRMICKLLIIGADPTLQAGFLSGASGSTLSYRLYASLGVGIGVARTSIGDRAELTYQLWSIPNSERWSGITQNFARGHRARIAVIRPEDTLRLEAVAELTSEGARTPLFVVVVGQPSSDDIADLNSFLGMNTEPHHAASITEVLTKVGEFLIDQSPGANRQPRALVLDPEACPPVRPDGMDPLTINTDEEVEEIQALAADLALESRHEICFVPAGRGTAEVSLRTGSVAFSPVICKLCAHTCKRRASICIVGLDSGWSSANLGNRALLTMAKIHALAAGTLPEHVGNQISCASQCSHFCLSDEFGTDGEALLDSLGYVFRGRTEPLLNTAERRVKEGRLGTVAYDMLKRGLVKARSRPD